MNNTKLYGETNDLARVSAKFIIDKYGRWLTWKDNETIMEIGVGTGNTTNEVVIPRIPSNLAEYVGVDINEDFLNMANITLAHHTKFITQQMNIESDEIPPRFIERFDHILSFTVLHWVQKPRKAFRNMYEMLKPDGEIFLMYFDSCPIDGALERLSKNPRWMKYGHEKFISPYYYESDPLLSCKENLKASGLKNCKVRIERMVFRFPSEKNCIDGLYSISPILHLIPDEDIEDYKRDYVECALKTGGYFEGNDSGVKFIGIEYNLFIVYAKK